MPGGTERENVECNLERETTKDKRGGRQGKRGKKEKKGRKRKQRGQPR